IGVPFNFTRLWRPADQASYDGALGGQGRNEGGPNESAGTRNGNLHLPASFRFKVNNRNASKHPKPLCVYVHILC
ncbi:MAG TPA: hypothetical protein VF751_12105, partial [Chthoniobacterales bacterium]